MALARIGDDRVLFHRGHRTTALTGKAEDCGVHAYVAASHYAKRISVFPSRGHHIRAIATIVKRPLSSFPLGASTMSEQMFTMPRADSDGPLLEERLRYLAHLSELGMRRIDLQSQAHFLLVIAEFLDLADRPDEVISREEISQKSHALGPALRAS